MDMVCEKEAGSDIDFATDGLTLKVDGEWLHADRTTLGGDDGIAVAYCLALLDDVEAKHPALELVITTEEETGMDGAKALDGSLLSGRHMINIDSEEENIVLCGCAGGARVTGMLPVERVIAGGRTVKVTVSGLFGGHSGAEIHKNRTNAVLLLARELFLLRVYRRSEGQCHPAGCGSDLVVPGGYFRRRSCGGKRPCRCINGRNQERGAGGNPFLRTGGVYRRIAGDASAFL